LYQPRAGADSESLSGRAAGARTGEGLTAPRIPRPLRRLRRVEDLAPADQRAVLKMADALVQARRHNSSRSKRRA